MMRGVYDSIRSLRRIGGALIIVVCGLFIDGCGESGDDPAMDQSRYSEPSESVELRCLDSTVSSFGCLLLVPLTDRFSWVETRWIIGDCRIEPASPLSTFFSRTDLEEDSGWLSAIEPDGFDDLFVIGGDADGQTYIYGTGSDSFYVLRHAPDVFEMVAKDLNGFLQWMIRERSDHLEGCPWEVFFEPKLGQTVTRSVSHRTPFDRVQLLERIKPLTNWTHEFQSPHGFSLFDRNSGVSLRFFEEFRGAQSYIELRANSDCGCLHELESFWQWLSEQGFGTG